MKMTFGNALFHFAKVNAPGGFLLKLTAFALVVYGALSLIGSWANWPTYEVYAEFIASIVTGDEPDMEQFQRDSQMQPLATLWLLIAYPLFALIWMTVEGATQRRYMRGEGFSLKVTADEWRLLAVGLIWVGGLFAAYIGLIVFAMIFGILSVLLAGTSLIAAIIVGAISLLLYAAICLYFATRFSAASALTMRDQKIHFGDSWRITRGRWGRMYAAHCVLAFIILLLFLTIYGAMIGVGYLQVAPLIAEDASQSDIKAALLSPAFMGPAATLTIVYSALYGVMQYVWGGVGALAAKTDPSWAGNPDIVAEFN